MQINVEIDMPGMVQLEWIKEDRGRHYYRLQEGTGALGIIVIHQPPVAVSQIYDCQLGNDQGHESVARPADVGKLHGKLTARQRTDGPADTTLSMMIEDWKARFPA